MPLESWCLSHHGALVILKEMRGWKYIPLSLGRKLVGRNKGDALAKRIIFLGVFWLFGLVANGSEQQGPIIWLQHMLAVLRLPSDNSVDDYLERHAIITSLKGTYGERIAPFIESLETCMKASQYPSFLQLGWRYSVLQLGLDPYGQELCTLFEEVSQEENECCSPGYMRYDTSYLLWSFFVPSGAQNKVPSSAQSRTPGSKRSGELMILDYGGNHAS